MIDFIEEDLDSDNVKQVEAMLKQIRDEHVGVEVNKQGVIAEYRAELGSEKVKE